MRREDATYIRQLYAIHTIQRVYSSSIIEIRQIKTVPDRTTRTVQKVSYYKHNITASARISTYTTWRITDALTPMKGKMFSFDPCPILSNPAWTTNDEWNSDV